jgi:hypothetical protein
MMHIRVAFILVGLSVLIASCGYSDAQKIDTSTGIKQRELSLNRTNDGHHISAKVGQPIVITLQTIGGGRYDTPQISSHVIRFEGESDVPSAKQNPGGPTQVYRFTATAEGEAQIRIPHTDSNPTVTFTIQVNKH